MICIFLVLIGDSGGPLILADVRDEKLESGSPQLDQIIGVISLGDGCMKNMDATSIHTQVNKFLQWINEAIVMESVRVKVFIFYCYRTPISFNTTKLHNSIFALKSLD